ncbi:MAG: hypothetical protein A3F13_04600 [Gammaproteobacteria bacterium RIFCSPHIGHO2_12_FULL_40_19]|nr:MAG: hypothetical protein A3F13_04600 [Gammaproteobacteria bacterium RIFCSPHIGHO2_12_FULL_40_19]
MNPAPIDTALLKSLRCFLLPAKNEFCHPAFFSQYEKTYSFWHATIEQALREEKNIDEANNLGGDPFIENDEAVILFAENEPVGLFMFHWINTQFTANRQRHALKDRFPENFLDALFEKKLHHLMLMGQLAVHPQWRKSSAGFGITDMLMDFAVTQFLESNADVLLTTTRNNRRTNDLCYRHGGRKIADNAEVFHVESDIVMFERHDVKPIELQSLRQITHQLWKDKIVAWVDMPLPFINHAAFVIG